MCIRPFYTESFVEIDVMCMCVYVCGCITTVINQMYLITYLCNTIGIHFCGTDH